MFIPSKQELEELGFNEYDDWVFTSDDFWWWRKPYNIKFYDNEWFLWDDLYHLEDMIYPQSLEDIKTLIRLLTP